MSRQSILNRMSEIGTGGFLNQISLDRFTYKEKKIYIKRSSLVGSDFGHRILSEIGTPGSSDIGVVPISDVPYSDVHCSV